MRRIGGRGNSISGGVAPGASGGVIVSGTAARKAIFADRAGEPSAVPLETATMFLAGYDRAGRIEWTRQATGHGPLTAPRVATADDGSAFMVGDFYPEAVFEGGGGSDRTLASATRDGGAFLVKYDANGALSWASSASGAGAEASLGVVALPDGGAVITGFFENTITFGARDGIKLTARGGNDAFVARYDADGAVAWAHGLGGPAAADEGSAIAAVEDGGIVVAGTFSGPFRSDNSDDVLLAGGVQDVFVVKYDSKGGPVWAARAGGPSRDAARGIARRSDGSVLVTGTYLSDATFGPEGPNELTLAANSPAQDQAGELEDIFVVALDRVGRVSWAIRAGGAGSDVASGIAAFPDGSFMIAGSFQGDATFGEGGAKTVTLRAAGEADIFMARYDANGALVWAERAGGARDDRVHAVTVTTDGMVAVTGVFRDEATFGQGSGAKTLSSPHFDSIFIARFLP